MVLLAKAHMDPYIIRGGVVGVGIIMNLTSSMPQSENDSLSVFLGVVVVIVGLYS